MFDTFFYKRLVYNPEKQRVRLTSMQHNVIVSCHIINGSTHRLRFPLLRITDACTALIVIHLSN